MIIHVVLPFFPKVKLPVMHLAGLLTPHLSNLPITSQVKVVRGIISFYTLERIKEWVTAAGTVAGSNGIPFSFYLTEMSD